MGDKVFLFDEHGILRDPNLFKDLREHFYMYEYSDDVSFFKFYYAYSDHPMIVYSEKLIQRDFINRKLRTIRISIADAFEQLNPNIMRQVDISYYQTVFEYYTELQSQGE